jgi:hypothetical protein
LLNASSSSRQEQMQQSRAISDFPKHPSDLAARSAAAVVVVLFLFADTCTGQHDENSQWECRSTAGHDELRMSARATLQPETRASAITAIASWCGSSLFSLDALTRTLALVSSSGLVALLFSLSSGRRSSLELVCCLRVYEQHTQVNRKPSQRCCL